MIHFSNYLSAICMPPDPQGVAAAALLTLGPFSTKVNAKQSEKNAVLHISCSPLSFRLPLAPTPI